MTSRQKELFRVHGVPVLQNKVYVDPAAARASPVGEVLLVQDLATGLVHNAAFDPRLLCYDTDYQNEQAFSGIFQQHLDAVTAILRRHWSGRRLLEVGCGKGWFLEHLQRQGFAITGIDPAYEGDNPAVVRAAFGAVGSTSSGTGAGGGTLANTAQVTASPAAGAGASTGVAASAQPSKPSGLSMSRMRSACTL